MSYVLTGVYTVLFVVFAVSASSKLVAPNAFAASLRPLQVLPERRVRSVAVVVMVAELVVASGVAWAILATLVDAPGERAGLVSLLLAGAVLVALTIGIVRALRRGADATCACFGASDHPLSGRHLVRNILLLLIVLVGLVAGSFPAGGVVAPAGAVVGLCTGAIIALVLIRLDDLIELFEPMPVSRGSRTSQSGS